MVFRFNDGSMVEIQFLIFNKHHRATLLTIIQAEQELGKTSNIDELMNLQYSPFVNVEDTIF